MNNRLQRFLDAENITQSQLAERLGVAKASISHILAGRNKPGFDFIQSMAQNYPDLNLDWLIAGKGKMYKSQNSPQAPQLSEEQGQRPIIRFSRARFVSRRAGNY